MMKFVSWNVNGLRSCINKGFYDAFGLFDADIFALQEIKLAEGQLDLKIPASYHQVWSYAEKKGYSGTAVFSKVKPLQIIHKLGLSAKDSGGSALSDPTVLDSEGRLCALEFERFWFVCCYTPNAQDELKRITLRLAWGAAFTRFVSGLAERKPVLICGDLNVAHQEIDLKNPGSNHGNAGFSDEERMDFQTLLDAGFTDSFRHLYPETKHAYSWWSFRGRARERNTGWRIDYFLVSDNIADKIGSASIYPEVFGSDHCPIGLEMNIC